MPDRAKHLKPDGRGHSTEAETGLNARHHAWRVWTTEKRLSRVEGNARSHATTQE